MLTLYARYSEDELRSLAAHCFDFCPYQYLGETSPACHECPHYRVCQDLTKLGRHCETLINHRKSTHC